MTTYGTIPTEPLNARERIRSTLGTRRPWRQMIQLQSFNLPPTFNDYGPRIKRNVALFYTNYVIVVLFVLFLSLLWHPISLIVFIAMMTALLYLYFLRDDPLVVFGVLFSDKFVMLLLFVATILGLYFTNVTSNIILALFTGLVLILGHGMLRDSDDLILDDYEEGLGSPVLMPKGGRNEAIPIPVMPTKNPASSAFRSPHS